MRSVALDLSGQKPCVSVCDHLANDGWLEMPQGPGVIDQYCVHAKEKGSRDLGSAAGPVLGRDVEGGSVPPWHQSNCGTNVAFSSQLTTNRAPEFV